MQTKFFRTDLKRFLKLGSRRKKIRNWRRPRGLDNKVRLSMLGHPSVPKIGFRKSKAESGKIKGLIPKLVFNVKDLENLDKKNMIAVISKVGAKKKLEMIKKAEELNIKIFNVGGKR